MKELVFFILAVLALAWGLYRCFKTKNERLFYALLLFASLLLHGYPLHWPIELSLSIWGFLGFFVMGYKILYKKLDKNLIVFAVVLLAFGMIFLIHGLWCPW